MELKYEVLGVYEKGYKRLNRTFMELKSRDNIEKKLPEFVLIEPLWN